MISLAIHYRHREGCSRRALIIFVPLTTIYPRLKKWWESGVWDNIFEALAQAAPGKAVGY